MLTARLHCEHVVWYSGIWVAFNYPTCNVGQKILNDFLELEIYSMPLNGRGNKHGIWCKHLCIWLHKTHFNCSNILMALELKLKFSETNEYVTDACFISFFVPSFSFSLFFWILPHILLQKIWLAYVYNNIQSLCCHSCRCRNVTVITRMASRDIRICATWMGLTILSEILFCSLRAD
jgi:hypothetical protein